ncbi:hypothetical protein FKM82_020937 [Ascaphus truei]
MTPLLPPSALQNQLPKRVWAIPLPEAAPRTSTWNHQLVKVALMAFIAQFNLCICKSKPSLWRKKHLPPQTALDEYNAFR